MGTVIKNSFGSLPSHRDGLDFVPFDGYTATPHKGEMVLISAQASAYRSAFLSFGHVSTANAGQSAGTAGGAMGVQTVVVMGTLRGNDITLSNARTNRSQRRSF